jgi:hypothetical protein
MTDPVSEAPTRPGGRKYRMRWWTLAVLSASLLIIIVDDTIVNVALPRCSGSWVRRPQPFSGS